MNLTDDDLISAVYDKVGVSRKQAMDLVDLVFETVKEELCAGKNLKITGFGLFKVRQKKERMGRNPRTGTPMMIAERRIMTFTPSRILRNGINGKEVTLPSAAEEEEEPKATD